jgi:hypothetical protein
MSTTILSVLGVVCLVLYLMRRRTRLSIGDED